MSDAWLNAFGAGLNIGVDVPTAVAGVGVDNHINGGVTAAGEQTVGGGPFGGFGPINVAVDVPTAVAGVGVDNSVNGPVQAIGSQDVGSFGSHSSTPFGAINVGVSTPTALAGVGVDNSVSGGVSAIGGQHVGDHGFSALFGGQGPAAGGDAPHAEPLGLVDHAIVAHH